jgi:hypothetical protein
MIKTVLRSGLRSGAEMIDPGLKQRIDSYVKTKFDAEHKKICDASQMTLAKFSRRGIGNSAYSTYADERHVREYGERVRALVLKKAEIMIEAYELYDAPLDDSIVEEARMQRDMAVGAISGSVRGQMHLEVMRNARHSEQAKAIAQGFRQQLTNNAHYVVNEVICMVEQKRVMQAKKREPTLSISLGDNGRVNIGSVDNSRNEVKG